MDDMRIRPALREDAEQAVPLLHSAGPALYAYLYDTDQPRALEYIHFEFLSGKGFCGHERVTVVAQAGEVLATACCYDNREYFQMLAETTANMLRFYGPVRIWAALRRAQHVGSVMKPPRVGELYLANFGVRPERRDQGIGSLLLADCIARARRGGYEVFGLDVAENNPRAEALYVRNGLQVVASKRFSGRRAGHHVPGSRKMELRL